MTMSLDLNFVDLPEKKMGGERNRSRIRLETLADALRAQRGKWAEWPWPSSSPYQTGNHINHGRYASLPSEEFQATVRNRVLYVRARTEEEMRQL
ncbi:hypothetical protein ALICE_16 [Mycobacterium phage Alice]|uniref:Uncharacterized protein n=4 Tax=Bixzunavirus TaxID=680114 RepID=A0A411AYY3_9CAUD|nr:hypothetical protein ALICE_16 [Mycobacterium phage Alice]AEJ94280.1 hypothetical protein ALICE_16 [Mycobacterium phage Alice]QAX93329.1 hypothetical protein SEA_STUBBY_19 [Mycobacterium phage Stubby]QOP66894.1 hypothetical protein PBI_SHIFA_18 [Mycobacterium phage Shifa]UEM46082.1 hypothetical protein SEA_PINKCREEK_13 [Mycobacterium phage Pinkcreek]